MIRLAVLSDLHVEKAPWHPPAMEADLIVLAGDIGWGPEGVRWIADHLHGRPAVYVSGNREYWRHPPETDPIAAIRAAAAQVPNLHYLQNDRVVLPIAGRNLRVLGATLWSDFSLNGDAEAEMTKAAASMPDYRNGLGADGVPLTPAQVRDWSRASAAFLTAELAQDWDGPTLVITHHAPAIASLKALRPEHVPTTASVTRLEGLIAERGPDLWVHGHTHWSCDYRLGRTRILSNQRGEPENTDYAPKLVEI
jgi:predicted phosphodiesterase